MSLDAIIKWCPECKNMILTTRQIEEGKPCAKCQQRHADTFKDRLDKDMTNEFNG